MFSAPINRKILFRKIKICQRYFSIYRLIASNIQPWIRDFIAESVFAITLKIEVDCKQPLKSLKNLEPLKQRWKSLNIYERSTQLNLAGEPQFIARSQYWEFPFLKYYLKSMKKSFCIENSWNTWKLLITSLLIRERYEGDFFLPEEGKLALIVIQLNAISFDAESLLYVSGP